MTCLDGKKKSILFYLPYWKNVLIRYNIDMMHIEKNCFDIIVVTILGQEGKSKDNYKARLDLEEMGIRKDLHVYRSNSTNIFLPKTCYQMILQEKDAFLKVLKDLKLFDEYSTNISICVQLKQQKLTGLKSYDYHILL